MEHPISVRKRTQAGAGNKLLTQTWDVIGDWKEHFEDPLSSNSEAESKDTDGVLSLTLAHVAEVVKKLPSCKVAGGGRNSPHNVEGSGYCWGVLGDLLL